MDPNTITLIIGLGGIVATLLASFIGIYYTYKSRVNPYNEALFSQQLNITESLIHIHWRMRNFLVIMNDKESIYKDQAREDLRIFYKEYSELIEKSTVLLPTEVWLELKREQNIVMDIIESYDRNPDVPYDSKIKEYAQVGAKIGLLSRIALGIDELTQNRIKMFLKSKNWKDIAEIDHKKLLKD